MKFTPGFFEVEVSPVDEAISLLKYVISRWCSKNPMHPTYPRKTCAELMQHLAVAGKDYLKTITKDFDNKTIYAERPMIQLSGFVDPEPTVWLLGWRAGEETPIHDHGSSEVGIHVFEGAVSEHIYVPEQPMSSIGDMAKYRTVVRELLEGSTVRITSPYVHLFTKTCEGHDCVHATTLHCYWPRLLTMDYFTVVEGEKLKFTDVWADQG